MTALIPDTKESTTNTAGIWGNIYLCFPLNALLSFMRDSDIFFVKVTRWSAVYTHTLNTHREKEKQGKEGGAGRKMPKERQETYHRRGHPQSHLRSKPEQTGIRGSRRQSLRWPRGCKRGEGEKEEKTRMDPKLKTMKKKQLVWFCVA